MKARSVGPIMILTSRNGTLRNDAELLLDVGITARATRAMTLLVAYPSRGTKQLIKLYPDSLKSRDKFRG
jgi:hypothetical protein